MWQKGERSNSIRGTGTFRFKEDRFKLTIKDKDGKIILDDKFPKSALPDYPTSIEEGREYLVYMGANNATVQSITPMDGIFDVICTDFRRPEEGAEPAPKVYEREFKGKKSSYQAFTAYFKILKDVNGDTTFAGVLLGMFLRYKLLNVDGQAGFPADSSNPQANEYRDTLIKFLNLSGADEEPLDWPEDGNCLPEILRRVLKGKRVFRVVMDKGYIVALQPLPKSQQPAPETSASTDSAPAASDAAKGTVKDEDW